MKANFKKQLWMLCGFLLVSIVFLGAVAIKGAEQIIEKLQNVSNIQLPAVRSMTLIDMRHDGLRAQILGAYKGLIDKDPALIHEIAKETDEFVNDMKAQVEILKKLDLNQDTKKLIYDSLPELEAYYNNSLKMIELAKENKLNQFQPEMAGFEHTFQVLEAKLEKLGEAIMHDANKHEDAGSQVIVHIKLISSICILIGIAFTLIFIKRVTGMFTNVTSKISNTSANVGVASNELSNIANQFSNTTSEVASSLQETVASLNEIASMIKKNSENAEKAFQLSQKNREIAEQGSKEITHLISAMKDISQSSKKIEVIINVIDDIAFQTNLLALNAAVEAARAGEQGKGFAVVADAVRSLAQRSAAAAKDISGMIRESVSKIEYGSKMADNNGKILNEIVSSVRNIAEINREISEASKEQSLGVDQINLAMNNLDQSTQDNTQTSALVAHNSGSLTKEAVQLDELVKDLNTFITGKAA
jgi:methyl-accepting chemotaxis protein